MGQIWSLESSLVQINQLNINKTYLLYDQQICLLTVENKNNSPFTPSFRFDCEAKINIW